MDILIKSFNRVYYLDRCLHSIALNLENFDGNIFVLDDGTPKAYLKAVKEKYPEITILKSDNYNIKASLIEAKNYNLPQIIPSKLWYESAINISDYFMVLEDDMWFTKPIDAKDIEASCTTQQMALLKLFWVSNQSVVGKPEQKVGRAIYTYVPKIQFKSLKLFKYVYMKHHKAWRKLMTILGLYSFKNELEYYRIYSVAGAVFKKDYYRTIWKHAHAYVDEKQQLFEAIKYYKHKKVAFGRTAEEVLKTGFISSAFPKYKYSDFSIHDFNATLNAYWMEDSTLFLKGLEADIDSIEIERVLKHYKKSETYIAQWKEWSQTFKQEFINMGCHI
jgi:hypothetical protein